MAVQCASSGKFHVMLEQSSLLQLRFNNEEVFIIVLYG